MVVSGALSANTHSLVDATSYLTCDTKKMRDVYKNIMAKKSAKLPKSDNMMSCLKKILRYRKLPSLRD